MTETKRRLKDVSSVDILALLSGGCSTNEEWNQLFDLVAVWFSNSPWHWIIDWKPLEQLRLTLDLGQGVIDGRLHQAKPKYAGCHPKNTLGLFGDVHRERREGEGYAWALLKPMFEGYRLVTVAQWGLLKLEGEGEYPARIVSLTTQSSELTPMAIFANCREEPTDVLRDLAIFASAAAEASKKKAEWSYQLAIEMDVVSSLAGKLSRERESQANT